MILYEDGLDLPLIGDKADDSAHGTIEDLPGGGSDGKKKDVESAMVAMVEGVQPLPRRVVRKVDQNEFVDFADLIQDQFPQEEFSIPASHTGVVLVQSLETLKKKKKKVMDFHSWVEALLVYTAAKYRDTLPEVANLMAYGVIIGQTARDHPAEKWLMYDRKFREMAGAKKDLRWNEINAGLWNRCFSSGQGPGMVGARVCSVCMATGHLAWECPNNGPRKFGPRKRPIHPLHNPGGAQTCYPYNNKGECDRVGQCPFLHKCSNCGDDHPRLNCRVKRRGP